MRVMGRRGDVYSTSYECWAKGFFAAGIASQHDAQNHCHQSAAATRKADDARRPSMPPWQWRADYDAHHAA
eukprot:5289505-Pyramimonas_sp.AAC.1